jgi:hypothetical protein
MLFFKRQWPIIIAFVMGILMWARFYIPTTESDTLLTEFGRWDRIIAGFASVLGILSLLHHHINKVRMKRPGFGYSYITITAVTVMALSGLIPWRVPGFAQTHMASGGPLQWMYLNLMVPMQATMFSILAFYIASAAFRAFRARSLEATALLVAACAMMIGRVPVGELIANTIQFGDFRLLNFPHWTGWLLNVPNAAAQRGILLGVILSQIAIAVRIIFGIERTYMGGGD